jgi:hypothetical protein
MEQERRLGIGDVGRHEPVPDIERERIEKVSYHSDM